jgi:hypothetical protein
MLTQAASILVNGFLAFCYFLQIAVSDCGNPAGREVYCGSHPVPRLEAGVWTAVASLVVGLTAMALPVCRASG